jgi:large subunit ribosomal protein L24e
MVKCSFCGKTIDKGTGKMLVKKDAKVLYFCSTKCEKNLLKLKRKPREHQWTKESRSVRGKKD